MFSVFNLKNSIELTDQETQHLNKIFEEAVQNQNLVWLKQLDLPNITVKECPSMAGTDIMGAFTPLKPNTIFLQRLVQYVPSRPFWLEIIFPTIAHELRHMYQYRKNRILYFLCTLPLIRNFTIERDAEKQTLIAEKFASQFSQKLDAEQFALRYQHQKEEVTLNESTLHSTGGQH